MKTPLALGFGMLAGCIFGIGLAWSGVVTVPKLLRAETRSPQIAPQSVPHLRSLEPDAVVAGAGAHSRFAVLARDVASGVVNVHTSKTVVQSLPDFGAPFGDLFGDFFGERFGQKRGPAALSRGKEGGD